MVMIILDRQVSGVLFISKYIYIFSGSWAIGVGKNVLTRVCLDFHKQNYLRVSFKCLPPSFPTKNVQLCIKIANHGSVKNREYPSELWSQAQESLCESTSVT